MVFIELLINHGMTTCHIRGLFVLEKNGKFHMHLKWSVFRLSQDDRTVYYQIHKFRKNKKGVYVYAGHFFRIEFI